MPARRRLRRETGLRLRLLLTRHALRQADGFLLARLVSYRYDYDTLTL
jgi:hypothetical protein